MRSIQFVYTLTQRTSRRAHSLKPKASESWTPTVSTDRHPLNKFTYSPTFRSAPFQGPAEGEPDDCGIGQMHRRIEHSRSETRGNAVLRHRQAKPHDQVLWGRLRGRFRRSAADPSGREAQTGRRDLVWGRMWRGKAGRLHAGGQLYRVDRVDRVALRHL